MAETLTARLGLRLYGAGTDTFSRIEYNNDLVAKLEALVAIDSQNTLANRPAAGITGRYFYATDNATVYRDNGSAWVAVGGRGTDASFGSSGAAQVPLTANGVTGQTADVFKAQVNSSDVATIQADGDITTIAGYTGKYATLTGTTVGQVVADLKGASGQTADLLRIRDNGNVNQFSVSAAGVLSGKFFGAGDGVGVIGTASPTTPTDMTSFTGAPAFEVYGKKGGANTTFTEYMYLHHQAADATAVLRRLGLLMQIGDATGDVSKSGAVYIESSAANAANPSLVLARANAPVFTLPSTGEATLAQSLGVTGYVAPTPTNDAHLKMGTGALGMQTTNMYLRAGASGSFYFYQGGVHDNANGVPGTGGVTLAQLLASGGAGIFATSRLIAHAGAETLPTASPSLVVGDTAAKNIQMVRTAIGAYNNGVAAPLSINTGGGAVTIGASGHIVNVDAIFKIAGRRLTISDTAPSSPSVGDIWIDT